MEDQYFRVPQRWVRIGMIVGVTALIVAPLAAIASHSFTDVPDSNTFHEDIAWLADSGVTRGCNPPDNTEFCPDDEVTREQMSAFMRRLAQYIGAEDGTPAQADHAATADDADTLDGLDSDELQAVVAGNSRTWRPSEQQIVDTATSLLSTEFTAPTDGFGQITARANVLQDGASPNTEDDYVIWAQSNNGTCNVATNGLPGSESWGDVSDPPQYEEQTAVLVVPVSAGTHTLTLCAEARDSGGSVGILDASISVVFSPTGNATSPGSLSDSADGGGSSAAAGDPGD